MKILKIYLNLLLLLPAIGAIKSKDLCLVSDFDLCDGNYGHKCRNDVCAISEYVCRKFLNLNSLLSTSAFRQHILFSKEIEKVKLINKSIRKCPNKMNYEFMASNLCIKRCELYQKKNGCNCMGRFKYDCGAQFCATSKELCYKPYFYYKINDIQFSNCSYHE